MIPLIRLLEEVILLARAMALDFELAVVTAINNTEGIDDHEGSP